jgi:hypothetical protein
MKTGVEPPMYTFEQICSNTSSASMPVTPATSGETLRSGPVQIPGMVTLLLVLGGGMTALVVYARRAKK